MKKRGRKASTASAGRKKGVKRKSSSRSVVKKRTSKSIKKKTVKRKKSTKKKAVRKASTKKKTVRKASVKRKVVRKIKSRSKVSSKEVWAVKRRRVVNKFEHLVKDELVKVERSVVPKKEGHTIPKGIRVLVGYFSVIALLYLVFMVLGFASPVALLFSNVLQGGWAMFVNVIVFLLLCYIIYGFIRRAKASFYIAFAWMCLGIINSITSLVFIERTSLDALNNLIALSSYAVLLINGLVIWYLLHEHHYFFDLHYKRKELMKQDKWFISVISVIWIVILLSSLFVGVDFYKHTTQLTDDIVDEISQKYFWQIGSHCDSKMGDSRDLCFMIHAALKKREGYTNYARTCDKISSDVYKFTCQRLVEEW